MTTMSFARPLSLALLVIATALAGCTASNDAGGQSLEAGGDGGASLSYNGASTGSHQKAATCGTSGTVNHNANLGGGGFTITITADGKTLYSKQVSGTGQKSATDSVSGPSGTWVLKVTRDGGSFGGFSGQYNVNLDC